MGEPGARGGPDAAAEPFPLVAYDAPCGLRDLALRRLGDLGLAAELDAESPHLSGVHAAVRNGLGYALLAAGGDGLRRGQPRAARAPISSRLWLMLAPGHDELAAPLRAALWSASARRGVARAA